MTSSVNWLPFGAVESFVNGKKEMILKLFNLVSTKFKNRLLCYNLYTADKSEVHTSTTFLDKRMEVMNAIENRTIFSSILSINEIKTRSYMLNGILNLKIHYLKYDYIIFKRTFHYLLANIGEMTNEQCWCLFYFINLLVNFSIYDWIRGVEQRSRLYLLQWTARVDGRRFRKFLSLSIKVIIESKE